MYYEILKTIDPNAFKVETIVEKLFILFSR